MSENQMQEKCECGHPKHAHYFGDATMDTPCGVCSCQHFEFLAPSSEGLLTESFINDLWMKHKNDREISFNYETELLQAQAALTAGRMIEEIEAMNLTLTLRVDDNGNLEDYDLNTHPKWQSFKSRYGGKKK